MHKRLWICIAMMVGCGDDDGSKDAGDQTSASATCATACTRASAAKCPNQPSDCQQQCQSEIASTPATCIAQVNAYASCITSAVFSCDSDGVAEAAACSAQLGAWLACAQGTGTPDATTQMPDAGTQLGDANTPATDANTPLVDAAGQDDASSSQDSGADAAAMGISCEHTDSELGCDSCLKTNCCPQFSACSDDCQFLLVCAGSCADDECTSTCNAEHASGFAGVKAIYDCMGTSCADACADELSTM